MQRNLCNILKVNDYIKIALTMLQCFKIILLKLTPSSNFLAAIYVSFVFFWIKWKKIQINIMQIKSDKI